MKIHVVTKENLHELYWNEKFNLYGNIINEENLDILDGWNETDVMDMLNANVLVIAVNV